MTFFSLQVGGNNHYNNLFKKMIAVKRSLKQKNKERLNKCHQ